MDDETDEPDETIRVTGRSSGLTVTGVEVTILDDDDAPEVTLVLTPESIREDGGVSRVSAILDHPSSQATTVTVSTVPGSSATDRDFRRSGTVLRVPAYATWSTGSVTVRAVDNDTVQAARTVTVSGAADNPLGVVQPQAATLTVTDDETASTQVILTVSPERVRERPAGQSQRVTVTATLDGLPRANETLVTVSVRGVAVLVQDFTVSIPAGDTRGTEVFELTAEDDGVDGPDVTVTVTGRASGLTVSGATLTITDEQPPTPPRPPVQRETLNLAVIPDQVAEGATEVVHAVTATLTGGTRATDTNVTVSVSGDTATAGDDFVAVPDFTLTIPAGTASGEGSFTMAPVDDSLDEPDETVTVSGAASGLVVLPATVTIVDDDEASMILAVHPASVPEGGGAARVTVTATLDAAAQEPVAVTLTLADGTAAAEADFAPFPAVTLTIPAGSSSAAVTVTVTPVDDAVDEGAGETVAVAGSAAGFAVTPATLRLADDDEAPAAGGWAPSTVVGLATAVVPVVVPAGGLAVVSVADARVRESAGATLDFAVRLSRARDAETRVDWATGDGTARAGTDYTAATGTLVFAAGETSGTVSVAVLADAHDEGEETLALRLSNPVGARLGDAQATGTIDNTGHIPRAWLARFGRTVTDQVLEAAAGRLEAARAPGTRVTLAGQRVGGAAHAEARALTGWRRDEALEDAGDPVRGLRSREVTGRDVLTGTSFALTGGSAADGFASVWGRGAVTRFDGREGDLRLEGEVAGAMLGADWRVGRGTAGLMLSHARGEGGYRSPEADGEVSTTLTGLYPYGRYAVNGRVTVWGVGGYGAGTLTLEPEGEPPIEAGMDLAMGAAGLRAVLVAAPDAGGVELAVKPDALLLRTTSEAVSGGVAAVDAKVTRLRVGVEGTWRGLDAGGGRLVPSLELGVRHDGGDAETGYGADMAGGLVWSDAKRGIEAKVGGRGLLTHEDGGLRERGFSASLAWDPAPDSERGVRLTLVRTMGASASSGADALLGRSTMAGLAANDDGEEPTRHRLEATFGYGFAVFGDRFTGTPEVGVALSQAERSYRLGWRLGFAGHDRISLDLKLEATRREPVNGDAPEHGVALRLNVRL